MSKNSEKSNTFAEFDEAILSAIRAGRNSFQLLQTPDLMEMAQRYAGHLDPDRALDRRLQALRKEGRIAFINKRWQCKDEPAAQEREEKGHA